MLARLAAVTAASILLTSSASQAQTAPFPSEPITLETPTGVIYGTLVTPDSRGPWPVALIIAGSGPTDRDGNSPALPGANNSLRLLAEALAAHGIASVRYDKRGIAASAAAGPPESQLRLTTYSDDAAAWLRKLDADHRFAGVAVIGHSEGSVLGMMALQQPNVTAIAFVSLEGAGRPFDEVINEQIAARAPALAPETASILAQLRRGSTRRYGAAGAHGVVPAERAALPDLHARPRSCDRDRAAVASRVDSAGHRRHPGHSC